MLDDEFYSFTLKNAEVIDGIPIASIISLICLKATAHLDLKRRKRNGEKIDSKDIKKHRNDIIRLTLALTDEENEDLPEKVKEDLIETLTEIKKDPEFITSIIKDIGINDLNPDDIFKQLKKTFNL